MGVSPRFPRFLKKPRASARRLLVGLSAIRSDIFLRSPRPFKIRVGREPINQLYHFAYDLGRQDASESVIESLKRTFQSFMIDVPSWWSNVA